MITIDPARPRVTSADFVRRFGSWQAEAAHGPVCITHHGRDRLVALSVASYQALARQAEAGDPQPSTTEAIIALLTDGFVAVDAGMRVVEVNLAAAGFFKVRRAALMGAVLTDAVPALRGTLMEANLARAIHSGALGAFDVPSPAFEGRWLHARTFTHGGGGACLLRDVTLEMEARRQRGRGEATSAALEALGDIGRARLSPRGTFVEVSDALATLVGFEPGSLLRARLSDILPLNRRVTAQREVEEVLAGGPPRAFETLLLARSGTEIPVRIGLAELTGDYGSEGATVLVTRR